MIDTHQAPALRIASALAISELRTLGFQGEKLGDLLSAVRTHEGDADEEGFVNITIEVKTSDVKLSRDINDLMDGPEGAPLVLWALQAREQGPFFA